MPDDPVAQDPRADGLLRAEVGPAQLDGGRFDEARGTFERVATSDELAEFLTRPAYDLLVAGEVRGDRMRQET